MATQIEFSKMLSKKGYTQKDACVIINDFLEALTECMVSDGRVTFRDFGKFEVRKRNKRVSHSVRTGQPVDIDAYNIVFFTTGKALREAVNTITTDEAEV